MPQAHIAHHVSPHLHATANEGTRILTPQNGPKPRAGTQKPVRARVAASAGAGAGAPRPGTQKPRVLPSKPAARPGTQKPRR